MKRKQRKEMIRSVLSLNFEDVKKNNDLFINLPNIFDLFSELEPKEDVDIDLDRTYEMYSFCSILGEEFNEYADSLEVDLDAWAGEKWRKYKGSTKKKYTDNDVKKRIESSPKYVRMKKEIIKYRKLYKQLAFGGGKAMDMKATNIRNRINRLRETFSIKGRESEEVAKKIKQRLKPKSKRRN